MMKVFHGLPNAESRTPCALTIGNFDGVHRGHQALLAQLRAQADRLNLPVVVILFEPQPGEYFMGNKAPARLSGLREKLAILRRCGVDFVCCLKFDQRLSLLSPKYFAQHYLFGNLRVKYLLLGHDFRFGSQRQGDVALLEELAISTAADVHTFANFLLDGQRVSSTAIRTLLQQGALELASKLLGRPFGICGRVIYGQGRGRQWGIPTANIRMHRVSLPLKGVFCVQVRTSSQQSFVGVANLGTRPTVDGSRNSLEVHLFDFDQIIYGKLLQVNFMHKLRDEIKFTAVDALITQIHNDVAAAKAYFAAVPQQPYDFAE